jgi:hypothetical protein
MLKQFPLHNCGHEEKCSAAECLLDQLGAAGEGGEGKGAGG